MFLNDASSFWSMSLTCKRIREIVLNFIITFGYSEVIKIWRKNGPVAAHLFTLISEERHSSHIDPAITTSGYQHMTFKINLPKCHQHIFIESVLETLVSNNGIDRTWMIHVVIGGRTVRMVGFNRLVVGGHFLSLIIRRNDSVNRVGELQPVIDLLQQELGETNVPISADLFIWFCSLLQ
jgi:hypothetical protein